MNEIVFNPLFEQIVINRQRTVKKSICRWLSGAKTNFTLESVPSFDSAQGTLNCNNIR